MKKYNVVGIGNAVVDVLAPVEDVFLTDMGVEKGVMQLVDRARGEALYDQMQNRQQSPGGSVANTMAGLAGLGLSTAFIGKVGNDALGAFYANAMISGGTDFINASAVQSKLSTSRSMIFVSPDGERSMNTYLGVSTELDSQDVDRDTISQADMLFLEGYLYDKPQGKQALEEAAGLCRAAGGYAGITLSDPFCVERHRVDFQRMIKELDYVIGNEHEWASLYQTDLDAALSHAASRADLVVCTCSGKSVIVIQKDQRVDVSVERVTPVDTTGAGDQFAAGFIYGIVAGKSLKASAQIGCAMAKEVIMHFGARPETGMRTSLQKQGLI